MTIEALLDVNVLIAASFPDHPHHRQAVGFVEGLEHFYTCPLTQGGFLRFATRPLKQGGVLQSPRLNIREARDQLVTFADLAGHVFLPDDYSFAALPLRSLTGHNQWTDAYLLALARKHHLSLATLDGRMANLDDPNDPVLVIIPV